MSSVLVSTNHCQITVIVITVHIEFLAGYAGSRFEQDRPAS